MTSHEAGKSVSDLDLYVYIYICHPFELKNTGNIYICTYNHKPAVTCNMGL